MSTGTIVDDLRYSIFLRTPGVPGVNVTKVYTTHVELPGAIAISGVMCFPSAYWDIVSPDGKSTIPEGSVVRGEWYIHLWLGGWHLAGSQESRVHTGIGWISRAQDQVVVGDTACWRYQVGYVTDEKTGKGWTVHVTSGAQGWKTVLGPIALTQTDGEICYDVQPADFSTSSTANELHAYLRNELWGKSFDITTTITQEQLAHASSCKISGVSPQSPKQGETVTVSFACTPASSAAEDAIDRIVVRWGYGSDDHSANLTAGTRSYDFVAGQSGYARLVVIAYTVNNVPSATRSVDIQVEHQPSNVFGGGSGAYLSLVLGLVLAIAGFVVFSLLGTRHWIFLIIGGLLAFFGIVLFVLAILDIVLKAVPLI